MQICRKFIGVQKELDFTCTAVTSSYQCRACTYGYGDPNSGPDVSEQNAASISTVDSSIETSVNIRLTAQSHILIQTPQVNDSVYNKHLLS